ncbi:hypothetical protein [Nocardia arthritidis]|uniref:Uncharacterized protein n=1 Tax=Nocardia arthritidis TaxID=228602 RepID=A0A6G9YBK0_9NOCA|nr:hypothetical protein [Nocardia arthritidis]QIS10609.1 hypothetical protein F5544_13605 [Nocardia arthritidis]
MRHQDPTPDEQSFFAALRTQVAAIDDWYHADDDGTLWVIASLDLVDRNGHIHDTLRVDYDGTSLRGGWSPAGLNWDDGVRATSAGIDTSPPDGLCHDNIAPLEAAQTAAEWFIAHRERRRR